MDEFKVFKSMHLYTIQIKQPTRCNNFSILLHDVCLQLNMFRTRGCYCSCWAPDDGREDARNMLSCK